MSVCDDCLLVAYDEGFMSYEEQAKVMIELSADVPDHNCEAVDEPDIECDCGCRGR